MVAPLRWHSGLNPMAAAAGSYGVQRQDGFWRKHPASLIPAGIAASTAARAPSAPRHPQDFAQPR